MRILGIDPGSVIVGYGCIELAELQASRPAAKASPLALRPHNTIRVSSRGGRPCLVECDVLRLGPRRAAISQRLSVLARRMRELIGRLRPDELALEEAFYGKSVQSALRIGEARGVILAQAGELGVAVHQFTPARVKRSVTGNGAASKDAVAAMISRTLSAPLEGSLRDVTDALAVALCRAEERRLPGP